MNPGSDEDSLVLAQEVISLPTNKKREFYHYLNNPELIPTLEKEPQSIDTWISHTLADAYLERPPIEYVVNGLFKLPSLNIMYAAPGNFKSYILADLAICVSSGKPWLEPAPWEDEGEAIPTKQCTVMWLDFDNGIDETHERFEYLGRGHDLNVDSSKLVYYSMPSPWLDASKLEHIGELSKRIKNNDARLVIIDNLGVVSGGIDENSNQMVQVMSNFRRLAEETRAAIVIIHHQRKGTITNSRVGDSLRGHSSIEAAINIALRIDREPYDNTVKIELPSRCTCHFGLLFC